ncbi:hypothetical protein BD769DRAFT_1672308 [Suillus cothurnatus]|nr:hypothetical protein BD769DRAFT_1672308 [Suillus cothurnatus]
MSMTNITPLFRTLGNNRFALPDRYRSGVKLTLTLDQVRLYLQHDADLRGGVDPTSLQSPVGYDEFAITLNSNTKNSIQVTLVLEDDNGVLIRGHPPTLAKLVGLEATQREIVPLHDPREETRGRWLDQHHSELMDKALWDNLNCLRRQRKWKERGVTEHWAKRQRREDEEALHPFMPSRIRLDNTHSIMGPSNTNTTHAISPVTAARSPIISHTPSSSIINTPLPPDVPVPDPPSLPADNDAEMDEVDSMAMDTTRETVCAKVKGRILLQYACFTFIFSSLTCCITSQPPVTAIAR